MLSISIEVNLIGMYYEAMINACSMNNYKLDRSEIGVLI